MIIGTRDKKSDIIKENIEEILEFYGYDLSKKELLDRMESENENLYKTINFRLLDDKYLKIFDETQLNIISTFPVEQTKMLTFNDDQLTMVKTIMDKNKDSDDFREILLGLLYNMEGYEKLCSNINIEQLEQKDIERMVSLLQYKNFLNIETEEQIRDFDNVKRERLEQIMEDKES